MIVNAHNMNLIRDSIMSIERYYLSDVQKYLVNIVKYRQEFVASIQYNKYDVVTYARGNLKEVYMCINSKTPVGTYPTDTTYWIPLAIKGEKGDAGVGLSFQGGYSPLVTYKKNDCVQYLGSLYGALQETTGHTPTPNGDNEFWALAWNFVIPDNYITLAMLSEDLKRKVDTIGVITDDSVPEQKYKIGADNGRYYIERLM